MAANKTMAGNKTAVAKPVFGEGALACPPPSRRVGEVRGLFGLSRATFARLTGYSERAIADWEGGKPMSEPARRQLEELARFRDRLAEVMAADAIPVWLNAPNPAFEELKPLEVIERGEIDRLWSMIFHLESGVPT